MATYVETNMEERYYFKDIRGKKKRVHGVYKFSMWYPHVTVTKPDKSSSHLLLASLLPECTWGPQWIHVYAIYSHRGCIWLGRVVICCSKKEPTQHISLGACSELLRVHRYPLLVGCTEDAALGAHVWSLLGATAPLRTAPVLPISIFITLACLPRCNLKGLSGLEKAIMGAVNFYACPL